MRAPAAPGGGAWKRPESVLVVIGTAAGEALLLERTHPPGFWQSVTGSLDWDEAAAAAARRELAEETGIDAVPVATGQVNRFPILPAWRARYHPGVSENVEHVFVVQLPARVEVRIDPAEHRAWAWLPREEAIARASSWTDRAALKALLRAG